MTTETPPPLLGPAATLRRRLTPWLQALGFILLALAVWMVVRQRDLFEQARASIAGASPGLIVAVLLLPIANWLIVSLIFHVLANQYARVRLGEMTAVIGSAWLLNVVPGRPGLMGRIAYHKVVNGMAVKDTVLLIVFGIVTNGVSVVIALTMLAALVLCSAQPHHLAVAAVGGLAALLAAGWFQKSMPGGGGGKSPIAPWRFTIAVALRFADYLVWTVRYQIAFSLIGFPIGWAESAGVAAVSQMVGLLPVQLGPREWAVGVVSRFLPSVKGAAGGAKTVTGLTADLLNRAAELTVSLPIGLVCTWWVYRRLRAVAGVSAAHVTPPGK